MKKEEIISLVNKLNKNKTAGLIHLRPLSETVDFAKVWLDKPSPTNNMAWPDGPEIFYFIKNHDGFYTAAVLDMENDLHWVVLPRFRGQGILTYALKETIMFHLFQTREEQKITINEDEIGRKNFKASVNVALKVGFVKAFNNDDSQYILKKDKYYSKIFISGHNIGIPEERMQEIKKQINYISHLLWLVQTEIEMKLGETEYTAGLKDLVKKIKQQTWRFEDSWWKSKKEFSS